MESRISNLFSPQFAVKEGRSNVGVVFDAFEIRQAHRVMGQRCLGLRQRGAQLSPEQVAKTPSFGRVMPTLPPNTTIAPPRFISRPGVPRSVDDVGVLDAANIALRLEKLSQTPPAKRSKEQNYEISILQRDLRQNIHFSQGQVTKEEWELAKQTMAAAIPPNPVTGKRQLV